MFLNVDLGHAALDEQRKLLRLLRLKQLRYFFALLHLNVSQYFIQLLTKNDTKVLSIKSQLVS